MQPSDDLNQIIVSLAQEYKIDERLVLAFCEVESSFNPFVMRYEPKWNYLVKPDSFAMRLNISSVTETQQQCFSYGMMQVMGSVCRELGYADYLQKLGTDAELGVRYGCMKLVRLIIKYDKLQDVIASYNAGMPKKVNGAYINQKYVDKVLASFVYRGGQP